MTESMKRQQGLTMVELMVTMAISLLVVLAAARVYLSARESQRAIDATSGSRETGAFVMQLLGREIMNAGFYPVTTAAASPEQQASAPAQKYMYDTYPPLPSNPRVNTDWQDPANGWPPLAFESGIFGCDGGKFNTQTSTCPPASNGKADTVVINYFTNDSLAMGARAGQRRDCIGIDVGNDPHNKERLKNSGGTSATATNPDLSPQLPIFVSNRFTLEEITIRTASTPPRDIETKRLVCSGNGKSPHGKNDPKPYLPIAAGLEDLQFTYAITTAVAMQFYTAEQINADSALDWKDVSAVRVCLLMRTLGGNAPTYAANTPENTARKYLDCSGTPTDPPAGDRITRYIEVFGLRNNMKQYY